MRFAHWPVATQILAGPLLLIVVLVATIGMSLLVFSRVDATARQIQRTSANMDLGESLVKLVVDMETSVRGYALAREEAFLDLYFEASEAFGQTLAALRQAEGDHLNQLARLSRVESLVDEWQVLVAQEMIRGARAGLDVGPFVRSGAGKQRIDAVRLEMEQFQEIQRQTLEARGRQDRVERAAARAIFFAGVVVAIAASVVVTTVAGRTARRVAALAGAANQMASGDLNTRLAVQGRDELSRTASAFNMMVENVRGAQERLVAMNATLQRQAAAEREANRVKDEFISLVSHELRTPLTSIKGYVDLLLEGEVGELETEQREFLTIVKNNADREVALVNDLLDISRIEAGKVDLLRSAIDLGALIRGAANGLRPQIEAKRQQLSVEVPTSLLPVDADANRVSQILTNLISNAHKYTPSGGSILVSASQIDGEVQVDVRDTGVGLTQEEQQHLFQKFYRAKNRATQEVSGTGLGLAITRQLVQLHGGETWVKSVPGEGSTFSFTLPVAVADQLPKTASTADGRVHAGVKVLVVDDEADIAQMLRRYLQRAGYQVRIARTVADALRLVQSEPPDLILLDILLPDGDGYDLLQALEVDPSTDGIPVILLSIVTDDGRGRAFGAVDYMTKPVQGPAVVERVRQVLSTLRPVEDNMAASP
jgi:two-component system, sensor histidine kinase and response regulator